MLNTIVKIITLLSFVIGSLIILNSNIKTSLKTFILLLAILFPLLDLNILPWRINFKLFEGLFFVIMLKYPKMVFSLKNNRIYFVFIFLIFSLITAFLSVDFWTSFWGMICFIEYLLFFCWIDNYFRLIGDRNLYLYFVITIITSFIFMIGQIFYGNIFTLYSWVNPNTIYGNSIRYFSMFQDPQTFGHYLVMVLFVLIYFSKMGRLHIINFVMLMITFISLLFTISKGPIIALAIGLTLLFIKKLIPRIIFLSIIIFSFLLINNTNNFEFKTNNALFKRFYQINESSTTRQLFWGDAINLFKDNILGIGFENYQKVIPHYNPNNYFLFDKKIVYPGQPENGYLYLLVSTGIFSFLIISYLIIKPIFTSYSSRKYKPLFYPIFLALISFLICFVTVYSLGDIKVAVTLFIILALYNNGKRLKIFKQSKSFNTENISVH